MEKIERHFNNVVREVLLKFIFVPFSLHSLVSQRTPLTFFLCF